MKKLLVLLVPLALLACEDQPTTTVAPKPGPTTAATQATLADTDLAVAADFEDKVAKEISGDNYKAELDKLEAEVVD